MTRKEEIVLATLDLAAEYDLNLRIEGSQGSDGASYAKSQDIKAGTQVEEYTVITVTFNQDNSIM